MINWGTLASIATISSLLLSGAWYVFKLDNRVASLEKELDNMNVSISALSSSSTNHEKSNDAFIQNQGENKSLQDTCNALAIDVAEAYKNGHPLTVAMPIEDRMEKLGCNK
ncbi:hypothetical protein GKR75_17545 [Providencia sp. wls1919]|nr:hypothetical protein [Providencia sp. wls1919]